MRNSCSWCRSSPCLAIAAVSILLFTSVLRASAEPPIAIDQFTFAKLAKTLKPSIAMVTTEVVVPISPHPRFQGGEEEEEESGVHTAQKSVNVEKPVRVETYFDKRAQGNRQRLEATAFIAWTNGSKARLFTDFHVVENATNFSLELNGKEYPFRVVESDSEKDVAILEIERKDPSDTFVAVELGDSDAVEDGEAVMTIGNPLEYPYTIAPGTIGRRDTDNVSKRQTLLQLDMTVNPGNSGGPVVNLHNKVIAVVVKYVPGRRIAFATPVNDFKALLDRLISQSK